MKPVNLSKLVDEIDWSFHDSNTKLLSHNIHRYSGKYIPQIANTAINLISRKGDTILDPYVGSGTTLVEANLSERKSIGIDLNPLAVMLSTAKINPISKLQAEKLIKHFEEYIRLITESETSQQSLINTETLDVDPIIQEHSYFQDEWFNKWFNKRILRHLVLLHTEITRYKDRQASMVALTSFSNILRRCSNAHPGYPNVMFDKKRQNSNSVFGLFLKELKSSCTALVEQSSQWNSVSTKVIQADAKAMPIKDESIDAIVTHPPYIGSVPYAEYGLLSLKWLGQDPKEIDKQLTGGRRQKADVVQRFEEDYSLMLQESFRVLKPSKYMFILIGHPRVRGTVMNLADMTERLAERAGFKLVIRKTRKGINRRANKMGDEDLLFFTK